MQLTRQQFTGISESKIHVVPSPYEFRRPTHGSG
jgi:hypothetical protein